MTTLQVEKTDRGAIVRLQNGYEVARMFIESEPGGKRRLHLVVNDTGEATMEMVLAVFKHAKAMGDIPLVS